MCYLCHNPDIFCSAMCLTKSKNQGIALPQAMFANAPPSPPFFHFLPCRNQNKYKWDNSQIPVSIRQYCKTAVGSALSKFDILSNIVIGDIGNVKWQIFSTFCDVTPSTYDCITGGGKTYIFIIHNIAISHHRWNGALWSYFPYFTGFIYLFHSLVSSNSFTVILQESRNTTHRTFKKACGRVCVVVGNQAGHTLVYVRLRSTNITYLVHIVYVCVHAWRLELPTTFTCSLNI